ncbi:MAG: sulfide/dihydroorotate dehydrogenase-like FAD/NAD-binding protein [Caldicoprobacterales bacterium]|jgi:ferredoxin--NADP+ reductase|nr:sulfide/dihydroorotate dehydrogenase-like FAD/NAD-binding protein [Clostridiales bacterium]
MFEIMEKRTLGPGIVLMKVKAPLIAGKAMPGQFIMLRVSEEGERIPLTIADYDRVEGSITIIFQEVGYTTRELAKLDAGDFIRDFAGPLGKPSELDVQGRVLCVGGGVGIAPLFPQIKYLSNRGNDVDVIIGARNSDYLILVDEIRDLSTNLYLATDDGSLGHKGFVTDIVKRLLEDGNRYDLVIAVGPLVMMKAVSSLTKEYKIPTTVSMNPIMVDGTGMCGGCRVTVGGKVYYACVDGPDFDGHLVDFDEAIRRQQMYREEEKEAEHNCRILSKI